MQCVDTVLLTAVCSQPNAIFELISPLGINSSAADMCEGLVL